MINTFQITENLEQIFPDVEGQLCSKHTILLNSVAKSFKKVYPFVTPSHFVIGKEEVILAKGKNSQLAMAMEQGVTLLLARGSHGDHISISTCFGEEIILQSSGKIINGQVAESMTKLFSRSICLSVDDLSLNKTTGGHIIVHFPQKVDFEKIAFKNSLTICMYLAGIVLNGLEGEYSRDQLVEKLKTLREFQENNTIQKYFYHFGNRELVVSGDFEDKIELQKKYKFIFLKNAFIDNNSILTQMPTNQSVDCEIQRLSARQIDIVQFMNRIELQQQNIFHNDKLKEFVNKIKKDLQIKASLCTQQYYLFLVQSYRYAQIIGKVSRMIHLIISERGGNADDNGQIVTKQNRNRTQSVLFSSVPSCGISIFNPQNAVWL